MPYEKYSAQEVESRGEAVFEQHIRHKVDATQKGKFVVLDIETGDYEIDRDDLQATKRALAKRPNAVLYGLRVGYQAAYRLGGRFDLEQR